MTKEEKIKEAWGNISDKINEDGWLYFGYCVNGWDDVEEWLDENNLFPDESYYDMVYNQCDNGDLINVKIRPKSLQGIEEYYSFVDIKGFENYQVNKQGIVISKSRVSIQKNGKKYTVKGKIMKPQTDNTGYIVFGLRNDNKQKKVYLHRILAECFIPNIENKPCVNHKDGVKYNNNLSNLEWCSYKENNIHAFDNNLNTTIGHRLKGKKGSECHNYGKGKRVYSDNKVYNNVREASIDLGLTIGYLYQCLCGAVPNKYNLSYQIIKKPKPPVY